MARSPAATYCVIPGGFPPTMQAFDVEGGGRSESGDDQLAAELPAQDYGTRRQRVCRHAARATLTVGVVLGCVCVFKSMMPAIWQNTVGGRENVVDLSKGSVTLAQSTCPSPPMVDGHNVKNRIAQSQGVLLIANPKMRCTIAIKAALEAKGAAFEEHTFDTPFQYEHGISDIWDYLHCIYPKDKEAGVIMHSYVFLDGEFIGQGLDAGRRFKTGSLDAKLGSAGRTCDESYPAQVSVVEHMMGDQSNKVLLFGWLECPCTGIAQARFASQSVCFGGRTWASPDAELMRYLQCKEGMPQDHSFVYFRDASGKFALVGNGFMFEQAAVTFEPGALPDEKFNALITASGAATTCHHANVKVNVYGTPLEECQEIRTDYSGSWMNDGTCSEVVGGIHQICVENLPGDFSAQTHQTAWSEGRKNMRHCVCIGAWSLYMTDAERHPEHAKEIMPHCKAIPETALTKHYMGYWKDWNGYPASVTKGLGELVRRCLQQVKSSETNAMSLKCGLKDRFERMEKDVGKALSGAAELSDVWAQLEQLQCADVK